MLAYTHCERGHRKYICEEDVVMINGDPFSSLEEHGSIFEGAPQHEIRGIQNTIRVSSSIVTRGYRLEYYDPSAFNQREVEAVNAKVFCLIGGFCVGKTTIMGKIREGNLGIEQIPEVKTRPLREGEVQGQEIESVSEDVFGDLLRSGELLIAYEANVGKRRHRVGIRKESFKKAIKNRGLTGVIMHPQAVMTLLQTFWIRTIVLHSSNDFRRYCRLQRGVSCHDSRFQDLVGGFSPDVFLPPEITLFVRNLLHRQEETAQIITSALLMPDQHQMNPLTPDI